jgi:hypothetical protein
MRNDAILPPTLSSDRTYQSNHIGLEYVTLLTQISGAIVVVAGWIKGVARRIDHVWGNYPKIYELALSLFGILSFAYGVYL